MLDKYFVVALDTNGKFLRIIRPTEEAIISYIEEFKFGDLVELRFFDIEKLENFSYITMSAEQVSMHNDLSLNEFVIKVENIIKKLKLKKK